MSSEPDSRQSDTSVYGIEQRTSMISLRNLTFISFWHWPNESDEYRLKSEYFDPSTCFKLFPLYGVT
jgi:hypothetical protein